MNDKWMKDLRKLGDDYTKTPPEGLLDDIKREMAARGLHVEPRRRAAIVPLWRRIAIAAGIAAILGVATLNYISHPDDTKPVASRMQNGSESTPQTGAESAETIESVTTGDGTEWTERTWQNTNGRAQRSTSGSLLAAIDNGNTAAKTNESGQTDATNWDRQVESDRPKSDAPSSDSGQQKVAKTNKQRSRTTPQTTKRYTTDRRPTYRNTSQQERWSFAARYSGAIAMNTANAGPTGMTMMSDPNVIPTLLKLSEEDARRLQTADVPPVKHEKHHRPIKVGVSVQYRLNDRWSLQTGLTYSRLTSDFTEEAVSYTETTNQKLHYVGVPVSVSYSVWRNNNVNVYVKAGGEVEKLVKGSASTSRTDEQGEQSSHSADVHEHRPVFSTHAAAGVEYQVGKVVGIFAEPGMEYYIKNGSGVKSSYTDKPFNVNLNVGLRVNL
ncbi:MAG: porin family protein [Prevotella sp.]|jgi:hypothetical protein